VTRGDAAAANATTTAGGGTAGVDATQSQNPADAAAASRTASSGAGAKQKTPPWSSSSWDADRGAAGQAMRDGRVPDAYRDVVSEYFRDGDGRDRAGSR
jgi:hypothetical protein